MITFLFTEKKEEPEEIISVDMSPDVKVDLSITQNGGQNSDDSETDSSQSQKPQTMKEILAGLPGFSMKVSLILYNNHSLLKISNNERNPCRSTWL
jgi:hypothetical protein